MPRSAISIAWTYWNVELSRRRIDWHDRRLARRLQLPSSRKIAPIQPTLLIVQPVLLICAGAHPTEVMLVPSDSFSSWRPCRLTVVPGVPIVQQRCQSNTMRVLQRIRRARYRKLPRSTWSLPDARATTSLLLDPSTQFGNKRGALRNVFGPNQTKNCWKNKSSRLSWPSCSSHLAPKKKKKG